MAANQYRPGRALWVLVLLIAGLYAWIFWPFSDAEKTPRLGLDLRGGTSVTLVPKSLEGDITQDQLNQAVNIIRQRVDGIGVAESEVTTQGSGANSVIVISVPGVNQKRIVDIVGQTAQLNFRPVLAATAGGPTQTQSTATTPTTKSTPKNRALSEALTGVKGATPSPTPSATPKATPKKTSTALSLPIQSKTNDAALQAKFLALDCTQPENRETTKQDDPNQFLVTCERDGSVKYLLDKAAVKGTSIDSASAEIGTSSLGSWQVTLNFDSLGTKQFAAVTTSLVSKSSPQNQFGIVLDGLVYSAPVVQGAITGGTAQITGTFTQAQAQDLAGVLKYGALPVAFDVAEVNSVSPTLGSDQLQAGLIAGALGMLLVVLYLLFYYRALGFVAVLSLGIAALLTYAGFVLLGRTIGFTLTLAGVAGAIVAIGITADSFIVYFERIRDELRDRRSLRVAVDTGWIRARRTILAADFVSFLAAVILYIVSVGNVRGFAFTLGLTTVIDVFVVFLFTRPLISLLSNRPFFSKGHPMSGVDPRRLGVAPVVTPATKAESVSTGKEA